MSAARVLPIAEPSPPQRRFLLHMYECQGGWLAEDPVPVRHSTIVTALALGWIRVERDAHGYIFAANLTARGIAALRWGAVDVFTT